MLTSVRTKEAHHRFAFIDLIWASVVFLSIGLAVGSYCIPHRLDLDAVHKWAYTDGQWWLQTSWMGARIEKNPLDLWTYSELLYEVKPDVLIECGTFEGGSALYYASLFDLVHKGRVISIDIERHPDLPEHQRITYLTGSSTSPGIVNQVKALIRPGETVMAVLDSDHREEHVLNELKTYSPMITPGSYLIVEDSNINGHPVYSDFGPGPYEALTKFLRSNHNFQSDKSREKYGITFFPGGWLKRSR